MSFPNLPAPSSGTPTLPSSPRRPSSSCSRLGWPAVLLLAAACQSPPTTRVETPASVVPPAPPAWRAPPPAPQVMLAAPTVAPPAAATSAAPQVVLPPVESDPPSPPADRVATPPPPAPEAPAGGAAPSGGGGAPPAAVLTEEQRNAAFRAYVGTPRTYSPLPPPRVVDRIAERVVYRDVRPVRHVHYERSYEPFGATLARTAVFTGVGAIIGHQYDHRGGGAAIGAGLALLTSPWRWYDDCDHRWGYDCCWD